MLNNHQMMITPQPSGCSLLEFGTSAGTLKFGSKINRVSFNLRPLLTQSDLVVTTQISISIYLTPIQTRHYL